MASKSALNFSKNEPPSMGFKHCTHSRSFLVALFQKQSFTLKLQKSMWSNILASLRIKKCDYNLTILDFIHSYLSFWIFLNFTVHGFTLWCSLRKNSKYSRIFKYPKLVILVFEEFDDVESNQIISAILIAIVVKER